MKRLPYILLTLIAAVVVACTQGAHQRELALVDSLMSHSMADSAYRVFKQIDRDALSDKSQQMYYDVLMSELSQIAISRDSFHLDEPYDTILNRNIAYYKHAGDPRNLVRAYLNKGKNLLEYKHLYQQASTYLKLAEEALPKAHDVRLSYQTYEALATLNYFSGNKDLALDYSYKTLAQAERSGNHHQMTYACNHLVVFYLERKEPDSVRKYSDRSVALLNKMPPKDRSYAFVNLGMIYLGNNQLDSAESYLMRAQAEMPQPFIDQRLAEINYQRGNHALADSLWAKALQSKKLHDQVKLYEAKVGIKYACGDNNGLADDAIKLLELKDSLVQQMQTTEVQEIQLKYDKEVERRKLDRFMMWSLVAALVLLAIIAAGVIYHIRRANRARERMMRDQVLLNDYQRQIEELERSGEDTSKDIQALRQKMDTLQAQQTEKLSEGRALYQRLLAGESVVTWSKEQMQKFIEYYKVVNLPFMLQMESDYTRLSPGNRFFLILQDMGMTDEQMTHILGVSDGALRVTRSRLRQKRTSSPSNKPQDIK